MMSKAHSSPSPIIGSIMLLGRAGICAPLALFCVEQMSNYTGIVRLDTSAAIGFVFVLAQLIYQSGQARAARGNKSTPGVLPQHVSKYNVFARRGDPIH